MISELYGYLLGWVFGRCGRESDLIADDPSSFLVKQNGDCKAARIIRVVGEVNLAQVGKLWM